MEQQRATYLVGELRDVYLLGKQSAVGVGEGCQHRLVVLAALLRRRVQLFKKAYEGHAHVLRLIVRHVVVEHVAPSEDPGILGIEAEDEADAEDVEIARRHRVVPVVLLDERVVEPSDNLAGLHRDLHLFLQVVAALVDEELQAVVVGAEVPEQDALRLALGVLHVVDVELGKVARHDPFGVLRDGQAEDIALCLLKRRQLPAVALKDGLAQVLAQALHLDHRAGGGYHHVDERGVVELHLLLEADKLRRLLHAIDVLQEVEPEPLALPFLISLSCPPLGELHGRRFLLLLCVHLIVGSFPITIVRQSIAEHGFRHDAENAANTSGKRQAWLTLAIDESIDTAGTDTNLDRQLFLSHVLLFKTCLDQLCRSRLFYWIMNLLILLYNITHHGELNTQRVIDRRAVIDLWEQLLYPLLGHFILRLGYLLHIRSSSIYMVVISLILSYC